MLIKDTRLFDVLVGCFYTSGFHSLYKSLESTEKIRILIGISTNKEVYTLIEKSNTETQPNLQFSHSEVKNEFENSVSNELEQSEDNAAVEEGIIKFIEWLKNGKLEIRAYPTENIHAKLYIHKDYSSTAEIQIRIYDDKIWIWNPGKLSPELSIDDLKKEHSSYPRNPLIANAFYLAGFIERWGSGTKRIVDLCKDQGLPEPEYKEEQGGFSVWFYKDIYTEKNLKKMELNERQIKAVMYVKEKGRITNKEYQEIANVKERTATMELNDLVNKKILQKFGTTGRGTFYAVLKTQKTH